MQVLALLWLRRRCARTSLPCGRRRERIAVGIERLPKTALAADLHARLLIERELLLVGDARGCRATPAILRQ